MQGIIVRIEARQGWSLTRLGRTWWWVAVAKNGEIVASSEVYSSAAKRDQTGLQVAAQLEVPYSASSRMTLDQES